MSILRTRLAVGLISLAAIALELALMRAMALRFWHHFAHMVIGVALLGFGASGTLLTPLRRRVAAAPRAWMFAFAAAFAASIPLALRAAEAVPLQVRLLAWDLSQAGWVLLVELAILVPFLMAAGAIGVALMDLPHRLGGHYAANLLGSGAGALAAVGAMHGLTTGGLLAATAAAAALAAAIIAPWRRMAAWPAVAAAVAAVAWLAASGYEPPISRDKTLPVVLAMPGTRMLHRAEGPLGRLDAVASPAFHYAPWLSLAYTDPLPPQVLMILDGDSVCPVYRCGGPADWRFADYATSAAGYHTGPAASVLILGAGGGVDIGLARYHNARRIVALEMNRQVIDAMRGPLRELGGGIYDAPGVEALCAEARGYLASTAGRGERFDLIQLPPLEAFGASGGGLYAARESYLYTVESFVAMIARLSPRGRLCITRLAQSPPRDALRVFDTAAEALRRLGRDPASHLAMIRSWATATVLVFASPVGPEESRRLREFCTARSFDLCRLPDMRPEEANRFHVLDRPYFHEGAAELLSPRRERFLREYLFDVRAATDDRPYFDRFLRWRSLKAIAAQRGPAARSFLELGHLMLLAALAQAALLAAALVLLPLAPTLRRARGGRGRAPTLGYFLLLGAGFMLLEMAFLQRLILYLAHPIYSAAVAIAAFLVFAGLGSQLSTRWRARPARVVAVAAAAVAIAAALLLAGLDRWLAWTQGESLALRIAIASATVAPLAFAMGHMFPTGLRAVSAAAPQLVPWAWAVNGFASVIAALAAPLAAMEIGFAGLTGLAVICYILAGLLAGRLPGAAGDSEASRRVR